MSPDDLFTGGLAGRSSFMNNNNPQVRRSDWYGKRTLAEFQTQNLHQQQQQQNQLFNFPQNQLLNLPQNQLLNQQQQQQNQLFGMYMRSVKPRIYQKSSPISPLDFSTNSSIFQERSTISSPQGNFGARYGTPMIQQPRSFPNLIGSYPNLGFQKPEIGTEEKMMSRLQELEKALLDDDDDANLNDEVSVITGSEWSETIQSLISPSPTTSSSSTSCSSSSVSIPKSSKQTLMEAATAISEGNTETMAEIIKGLVSNQHGTPEQKIVFYMINALKSKTGFNPVVEITASDGVLGHEHMESTQLLYHHSAPFKLCFMAANLAIVEATSETKSFHVLDFDVGTGLQYQNLLQLLSSRKSGKPNLIKITAFHDIINGGYNKEKSLSVGAKLTQFGEQLGIRVQFETVSNVRISDLSRESFHCDTEEVLIVNFGYTLFKTEDESVSTENPRDHLLRRVKGLRPRVTTLLEQEMNCNTTQFVSRVSECYDYYSALVDSLDLSLNDTERVKIEEGLGRKIKNAVAREGSERVERCEVFGKWRARMGMAGFQIKPVSQPVVYSLKSQMNSGTRVKPGLNMKEENGGVYFGWMGRSLTVSSAWI